jgi:hypothetical protein
MNINPSNISMSYEVFRINICISDGHNILYDKLSSASVRQLQCSMIDDIS